MREKKRKKATKKKEKKKKVRGNKGLSGKWEKWGEKWSDKKREKSGRHTQFCGGTQTHSILLRWQDVHHQDSVLQLANTFF